VFYFENKFFSIENFKTKKDEIMGLFSNFNGINCDNKSFNFIEKMDVKKHIIMNALEKFSRK